MLKHVSNSRVLRCRPSVRRGRLPRRGLSLCSEWGRRLPEFSPRGCIRFDENTERENPRKKPKGAWLQ
jgi:hypothetical protein